MCEIKGRTVKYNYSPSSSAALTLVKLTKKVKISVRLTFYQCYFWTDSSVVLGWQHVHSGQIPADLVSRGVKPLFINGPSWLLRDESLWSENQFSKDNILRWKRSKNICLFGVEQDFIKRYSKLNKVCRITAYIFRFFHNCKARISSQPKQYSLITTKKVNHAIQILLKILSRFFSKRSTLIWTLRKNIQTYYHQKVILLNCW